MKKTIRHISCLVLTVLMICTMPLTALADDLPYPTTVETAAEGFVIYDVTDGTVILGKNEDTVYYPASITKIMTALLVCELIEDLDEEITFTEAALSEMTSDSSTLEPSASVGEVMTVEDALYGMFLVSANECAAQLGITVAGSTEAFAELMNERAQEIGCVNTNFVNAHGLHSEDHYTTARDMALIFGEAIKNQAFLQMATTYEYEISATNYSASREISSSHSIVNGTIIYPEVYAGKTGRTTEAGRTLCTAAQFNGHDVVIVIMGSTDDEFYNDTLKLLEYARGYFDGEYTDMTWEENEETVYVYKTNSLKVRSYPSSVGTSVLGSLQYGQAVTRVATWGEWSMIEYMSSYYYVHSDYLTTQEPEDEYDPSQSQQETTRESVDIEQLLASVAEEADDDAVATATTEEEYTRIPGVDVDDQSDNLSDGSKGSIIRVILIVCVVLMILLATGFAYVTMSEKKRRKRRKHRIDTDEWYK